MRIILATTLLATVTLVSPASAAGSTCGPAIQNWQNGSRTTCTYDSNTGGISPVQVSVQTPAAPPPPPPQEKDCDRGDYDSPE